MFNKLNKRISLRNKFIEYKLKSITDIELSNLRNHLKKNPDTLNIFDPEKSERYPLIVEFQIFLNNYLTYKQNY